MRKNNVKALSRRFMVEMYVDRFCEMTILTVWEVSKTTYTSVASARNAYNNYIRETGRSGKVKVMTRGEKIFLYKI